MNSNNSESVEQAKY